ncbi:MAG: hypothetical protein MJ050_08500 [Phascolarctobacterium sp.]|nr:hypothetical protein [Phascolarctobacterium sp.]
MKKTLIIGGIVMACAIYTAMNLDSIFAQEPKGELVKFHLGLNGTAYKSGYNYTARFKDDELYVHMYYYTSKGIVEKKRAVNSNKQFLKDLDTVIKEQKIYKWNGFHKSPAHILDGEGFGFNATYRNGKDEPVMLKASGSNAFPKDYRKVSQAVGKYFKDNVDKLPTVKAEYTFAEVKPEIMAALNYMQEKGLIKNNVGGEVFAFTAKGNPDLAMIIIDVAMDPGHSFQALVRNHKLIGLKVVAADGKNIKPKCALCEYESNSKLREVSSDEYELRLERNEI